MSSTSLLARRAAKLVALGVLALYGGVSGSTGCGGDQACIQWGEDEGPCPPKDQAIRFMAPTCDVRLTIESEGDYDGVTCCYDVNKEQLEGCPVSDTTSAVGGTTTTVSASSVSSTGSGPPPSCDLSGDCNTCQECASFGGACTDLNNDCNNTNECVALQSCLMGCMGDPTCANTCMSVHPDGVAMLEALTQCTTCQECPSDCGCMSG